MPKDAALAFRISAEMKEALSRAAAGDDRSVSSMVEKILKQYLRDNGYLTESKGKRKP